MSELHQNGKTDTFKTRSQEMGYVEELKNFIHCASGKELPVVSSHEMFATMSTIFAIERALATAQVVTTDTL